MKNTFGDALTLTIFGESHGPAIGATIDGLTPGIRIDEESIRRALSLRRPQGKISTSRVEADEFSVLSGVFRGKSTGTPFTVVIPNADAHSGDYSYGEARPGHADLTAYYKYHGFEDYRGGGHFSGRLTAAIVAVCAPIRDALEAKGIFIGTHIKRLASLTDRDFNDTSRDVAALRNRAFPVLNEEVGEAMIARIEEARALGDSVGGVLETVITGVPAGVGEPFFDSVESRLSHALFSIPAVKGVEFGEGFGFAALSGSEANDPLRVNPNPGAPLRVIAETNHNGGVNGGITNGMPILFRTAVKPTPTIAKAQKTVNFLTEENTLREGKGRHDPAVIHRARVVVDSLAAFTIADLLLVRYGTDDLL